MELDLSPKLPKKVYGGDGGSYFAWCPEELPMLKQGNVGAAKLALEKHGFAIPRYSDSSKVAYVLQGSFFSWFSSKVVDFNAIHVFLYNGFDRFHNSASIKFLLLRVFDLFYVLIFCFFKSCQLYGDSCKLTTLIWFIVMLIL